MHDNRVITEGRIDRFVRDILVPALYIETVPLTIGVWDDLDEPLPFADAVAQSYRPVELPYTWGKAWSTSWFHVTGQVPQEWLRGDDATTRVELVIDLGFTHDRPGFQVEGLAFRPDGTSVKSINPRSSYVAVPQDGDGAVDLYIEGAANPNIAGDWTCKPTPLGDKSTAGDELLYVLRAVRRRAHGRHRLGAAAGRVDPRGAHEGAARSSRRAGTASSARSSGWSTSSTPTTSSATAAAGRDALAPVLALPASASSHSVVAIGHAHIDSAWLWPIRETIRKCARTFSSVVALMDADPDVPLRMLVGAAAQVDEGWLPRAVRADQGEGRDGAVHPRRRHVGRTRHEHARRTRRWRGSSSRASGSSSRSSASTPARRGFPTRSATRARSRRSSRRRARSGS